MAFSCIPAIVGGSAPSPNSLHLSHHGCLSWPGQNAGYSEGPLGHSIVIKATGIEVLRQHLAFKENIYMGYATCLFPYSLPTRVASRGFPLKVFWRGYSVKCCHPSPSESTTLSIVYVYTHVYVYIYSYLYFSCNKLSLYFQLVCNFSYSFYFYLFTFIMCYKIEKQT